VQAVPASVTRYGLSTIINHMLELGTAIAPLPGCFDKAQTCIRRMTSQEMLAEQPRVFDIIIDGELLRQTLGEALLSKDASTEATIILEYTLLATPPTLAHVGAQSDWCSFHFAQASRALFRAAASSHCGMCLAQ
jgi:hypothetical protein